MINGLQNHKILHCNLMQSALAMLSSDGALIIHNPRSCSHIVWNAYCLLGKRYEQITGIETDLRSERIFSTALNDKDAVFGAGEKLRECILDVAMIKKPSFILVACGCVPGIIGDDTEMVCRETEREIGISVILLPGHGFMVPDQLDTVLAVAELFFERFTKPYINKKNRRREILSVIGLSPSYMSEESYQEFIEFWHVLGFERIYIFPIGMKLEDYKNAAASYAVISYPFGVRQKTMANCIAERIAESWTIPYIKFGETQSLQNLKEKYLQIGERFGREREIRAFLTEKEQDFHSAIFKARKKLNGRKCILKIGMGQRKELLADCISMLKQTGLSLVGIQFSTAMPKLVQKELYEYLRWHENDFL